MNPRSTLFIVALAIFTVGTWLIVLQQERPVVEARALQDAGYTNIRFTGPSKSGSGKYPPLGFEAEKDGQIVSGYVATDPVRGGIIKVQYRRPAVSSTSTSH